MPAIMQEASEREYLDACEHLQHAPPGMEAWLCHVPDPDGQLSYDVSRQLTTDRTYEPFISVWIWSEHLQDAILICRARWTTFPRRDLAYLYPGIERQLIRQGFYTR